MFILLILFKILFKTIILKGELHLKPKLGIFVRYVKVIITVLKYNVSILKQIILETRNVTKFLVGQAVLESLIKTTVRTF